MSPYKKRLFLITVHGVAMMKIILRIQFRWRVPLSEKMKFGANHSKLYVILLPRIYASTLISCKRRGCDFTGYKHMRLFRCSSQLFWNGKFVEIKLDLSTISWLILIRSWWNFIGLILGGILKPQLHCTCITLSWYRCISHKQVALMKV